MSALIEDSPDYAKRRRKATSQHLPKPSAILPTGNNAIACSGRETFSRKGRCASFSTTPSRHDMPSARPSLRLLGLLATSVVATAPATRPPLPETSSLQVFFQATCPSNGLRPSGHIASPLAKPQHGPTTPWVNEASAIQRVSRPWRQANLVTQIKVCGGRPRSEGLWLETIRSLLLELPGLSTSILSVLGTMEVDTRPWYVRISCVPPSSLAPVAPRPRPQRALASGARPTPAAARRAPPACLGAPQARGTTRSPRPGRSPARRPARPARPRRRSAPVRGEGRGVSD